MKLIDFTEFEEVFKLKTQTEAKQLTQGPRSEPTIKRPATESLLEPNRSQNVAIAKKRVTCSTDELKQSITT